MRTLYNTERSKDFELQSIQDIDENGVWVTARDAEGAEVEVTIYGLTREAIATFDTE